MIIISSNEPKLITMLCSAVMPSAKLPLSRVKGSAKERNLLSKQFTQTLREELEKVSNGKKCKVDDFKAIIDKILFPHNVNFEILPLKSGNFFTRILGFSPLGTFSKKTEAENKILQKGDSIIDFFAEFTKGYTIKLLLQKKGTVINDKYSAFHEAIHLFDYLCNPKMINNRRLRVLTDKDKSDAYINAKKIFISDINCFSNKILQYRLKKQFSKLTSEERIDCLQDIKHILTSELHAYARSDDYMQEKFLQNYIDISGNREFFATHRYYSRLNLVKTLLADELKSAREEIKKQNENLKKSKSTK